MRRMVDIEDRPFGLNKLLRPAIQCSQWEKHPARRVGDDVTAEETAQLRVTFDVEDHKVTPMKV
jgi:hypothetical protein